uniref:(northern house mosquito) hypothetical protein n=1 Tax=Culex pipiens TaxID=7175 RepID=A0A8D8BK29_CULPI
MQHQGTTHQQWVEQVGASAGHDDRQASQPRIPDVHRAGTVAALRLGPAVQIAPFGAYNSDGDERGSVESAGNGRGERTALLRHHLDTGRGHPAVALIHGLQLLRGGGDLVDREAVPVPVSVQFVRTLEERHVPAAAEADSTSRKCAEADQGVDEACQQGEQQAGWEVDRQAESLLAGLPVRLHPAADSDLRQSDHAGC